MLGQRFGRVERLEASSIWEVGSLPDRPDASLKHGSHRANGGELSFPAGWRLFLGRPNPETRIRSNNRKEFQNEPSTSNPNSSADVVGSGGIANFTSCYRATKSGGHPHSTLCRHDSVASPIGRRIPCPAACIGAYGWSASDDPRERGDGQGLETTRRFPDSAQVGVDTAALTAVVRDGAFGVPKAIGRSHAR